jgi:uncharacterized protein YciI
MDEHETHHLLLYDYVEGILERREPYRQEHLTRIRAECDAGRIIMAGALGEPPSGAALVFRGVDAEQIEAFVRGDPYVRAGLVTRHQAMVYKLV